jgi:hypothetical protein
MDKSIVNSIDLTVQYLIFTTTSMESTTTTVKKSVAESKSR